MGIYVKKNACTYSLQFFSSLKNLIFRINIIFITFRVSILFFWYYCSICSTIVRVYLFFFCLLNHEYLITANNLTINFKSIEYTTYQSLYKTLHEKILYTSHVFYIFFTFYLLYPFSNHTVTSCTYIQQLSTRTMDYPSTKAWGGIEREGKKHVENRNRKRSEMERYRARRGGELARIELERVIRRDPRVASRALWHEVGGGGTRPLFPYLHHPFLEMYS